jgi:hypothetical protein
VAFIAACLRSTRVSCFNLLGRLERLVPRIPAKVVAAARKPIWMCLGTLNRVLLAVLPPLSRFCGTAIIIGEREPVLQHGRLAGSQADDQRMREGPPDLFVQCGPVN